MKTNLKTFLMLVSFLSLVACSVPPDAIDEQEDATAKDGGLDRPQTIFEGTWTWLKTEGEGIAGPYKEDSTSVGYSLHYKFGFSDLRIVQEEYRDNYLFEDYTYTFTINEPDSLSNRLDLTRKADGTKESFYWEIETIDDKVYMVLRNTEPCCDNTFEKHFRRIAEAELNGSK